MAKVHFIGGFRNPLATALFVGLLGWCMATPYVVNLRRFGSVPYNDYYGILEQVTNEVGFSSDPVRWLSVKSNEHIVVLPTVVYALNVWFTGGDNRSLSAHSGGAIR